MSDPSYSTKVPESGDRPQRAVPSRLGGYRIVKQLGHGGMGVVYRAEDEQLRRPVALKVMRAEVAAHEQARARFIREAQAAAKLKHDHIVTIYQVGEDQGVPFLAMEFLQGKSLEDWLRPDRRATVPEALAIAKQIARGLAAAHAVGLIHRDIKPANLWLEAPRGRVKILDFGLARLAAGEVNSLTQTGDMLGTPAFMSPEQGRGEHVDARSDLFSLGCVLYRMLGGRLPFQGSTPYSVLMAIATETPTPLRDMNPNVPPRLEGLVDRLLAKKADERPPAAQAVLDELVEIEKETKEQSATPTIAFAGEGSVTPPGGRRIWLWPAIAGGVVLAAIAIIVIAISDRSGDSEKKAGPQPSANPKPVDLLARVDVKRDTFSGKWTLNGGKLVGQPLKKDETFHLILPWEPPAEYVLKVTITRKIALAGHAAIGVGSGHARPLLQFDFVPKKSKKLVSGIALIDGKGLYDRPDGRFGLMLHTGEPTPIVITVRPAQLRVEVKGVVIADRDGPLQRAGRAPRLPLAPLVLGGYDGIFEFSDVVLEPLGDDVGRPMKR